MGNCYGFKANAGYKKVGSIKNIMKKYKVSIIIPVYNGSMFVGEAIEGALAQTYKNIEIIVINDGSTDSGKTEKIIKQFGDKVRYFKKKNGGVATALNLGIEKMTGEYFSWLSHDDLYKPNKIEEEMALIKKSPAKTIVYCNFDIINASGQFIRSVCLNPLKRSRFIHALVKTNFLHGCGLLIPKSAFIDAGFFKPELRHTQDYDLWFRMFQAGYTFKLCPKTLIKARQHLGQDSFKGNDKAIIEKDNLYCDILTNFGKSDLFPSLENASLGYIKIAIHSKMLNLSRSAKISYDLSRKYLKKSGYLIWLGYNVQYFFWNKFTIKMFYLLVQTIRKIKRR